MKFVVLLVAVAAMMIPSEKDKDQGVEYMRTPYNS